VDPFWPVCAHRENVPLSTAECWPFSDKIDPAFAHAGGDARAENVVRIWRASRRGDAYARAPHLVTLTPTAELLILQWLLATVAVAEAETVAALHELNAEYVCRLAGSDTRWCREHLSYDFVGTLADGRRVDKTRFLRLSAGSCPADSVTCDEVDVRPHGQLGLVHGVAHSCRDGVTGSTRYTHVWLFLDDRWQLAAAQFTRVATGESRWIF
jgi:Domain of unknown function (DUF4440)